MKKIFEKIYKILDIYFTGFANGQMYFGKDMEELKKLIDNFEEADLTEKERKAAEEIIGRCE